MMDSLAEPPSKGKVPLLLPLAIALLVGAGVGLATCVLTYYQMQGVLGRDDVAYALGGGIGCLVTGILLLCWRIKGPDWLWPLVLALLLGTGIAFSTLSFFWWLQRSVFRYRDYPDLNYLLGEVGGYSGPGLGLLTCGIVLMFSSGVKLANGRFSPAAAHWDPSLTDMLQRRHPVLELLLLFSIASFLGAGAGLLSGAMTYLVLFGTGGSTSVLAGFLAGSVGCLVAAVTFLLLCAQMRRLYWFCLVVVVGFLLWGSALCLMGLSKYLRIDLRLFTEIGQLVCAVCIVKGRLCRHVGDAQHSPAGEDGEKIGQDVSATPAGGQQRFFLFPRQSLRTR